VVVLDLFVLNRKAHVIGIGEALKWSALWVSLALAFNVLVYFSTATIGSASPMRTARN